MKTMITTLAFALVGGMLFGQEEPDTTKMTIGGKEILIISPKGADVSVTEVEPADTINAEPDEKELADIEAHWAGLEFGPTILMNADMKSSFPNHPYWENDPGKSFSWNLNIAEHKFKLYKNYVGVTTGLGFNWTQVGLRQYNLVAQNDTLTASIDTVNTYATNKLRAIYLTAPLMMEFCSKGSGDGGFYLAAGVVGGVRIGASNKYYYKNGDQEVEGKTKNDFALNAFRLDGAVKLGYGDFGVFANYSLLPLFDTKKTAAVYPLTLGMTLNF